MSTVANFLDDARDVLHAPLWPVFNRYVKAKRTISEAIQGPQHPTPPFNKTFPAEAVDTYLDYLEARSAVASLECEYRQSMKRLRQDAYRNRLVSTHEARARTLVSDGMKRKQRLAFYFEQEIAAAKVKENELERALAHVANRPSDVFNAKVRFNADGKIVVPRARNEAIAYFDEIRRQIAFVGADRHPLSKGLKLSGWTVSGIGAALGLYGALVGFWALFAGALTGVGIGLLVLLGVHACDRHFPRIQERWNASIPEANACAYEQILWTKPERGYGEETVHCGGRGSDMDGSDFTMEEATLPPFLR